MIYKMVLISLISLINKSINIDINHNFTFIDKQISIACNYYKDEKIEYQEYLKNHSFNGELDIDIAKKINRYLNSTLKGKGDFIVSYSLEVGMDPYLAASVMLQETGCRWKCSYLTRVCNNVGGNKGHPSCNGGSYRRFNSLDDGIKFAIDKLNKYYKKGLTTPKQINNYYATDKTWYKKVNNYIKLLKK